MKNAGLKSVLIGLVLTTHCFYFPVYAATKDGLVTGYSLDDSLKGIDGVGKIIQVDTETDGLKFVKGNKGKGLDIPRDRNILLPIDNLNPREGTLSFWFKPEWSSINHTPQILFELNAGKAFQATLRKGWTAPDHCYLTMGKAGGASFPAYNIFTANQWRHYALRWSADQGKVQFVVDGESLGRMGPVRTGRFKCDVSGPVKGSLTLAKSALGAFDDIKVFNKFLDIDGIIKAGGLKKTARFLQEQTPPPGAPSSGGSGKFSYVDPATGENRDVYLGDDKETARGKKRSHPSSIYNPKNLPELRITPHTKWAKPLPGGPIKVLFVMPTGLYDYKSPLREAVELWQRLDMDCDVTDKADPEILKKSYDVIAVTHQKTKGWSSLDSDLRKWIVMQVESGKSGLVYAYPNQLGNDFKQIFNPDGKTSSKIITKGFPTAATHRVDSSLGKEYGKIYELEDNWFENPDHLMDNVIEVFKKGKIRAVKLNYVQAPWSNSMAFTPDTAVNLAATDVDYDHWTALAIRAILFAAGRHSKSNIAKVTYDGETWKVEINGLKTSAKLWCRAEDRWERIYLQEIVDVPKTGGVTVKTPNLPPRTFMDFILSDDQGNVLDWYCAATPAATDPKITGIYLDKEFYRRGETVRGVAEVVVDQPGSYATRFYLTNREGRRLVCQDVVVELKDGLNRMPFELAIPASSDSLLMAVEMLLMKDGKIYDARNADVSVPEERSDGFYVAMYGIGQNRFYDRQCRTWFRDDFNVNLCCRKNKYLCGELARENLRTLEYSTHLGYPKDEKSFEKWMEPWEDFFPKKLHCDPRQAMKFRPLFYSLGEEHYMLSCGSKNPKANELFRKRIKKKYGKLEKLNEAWGTKFKSWSEVRMMTPEIVDILKIKYDVPRFENRRFMEHLFADKHAFLADWWRRFDSKAKVGIHVGWDLWTGRGYDYWLLSKGMETMMGYVGPQNQYIRSFFKNHYGCWYHFLFGNVNDVRWHPWSMLMSGAHGFGWVSLQPIGEFGAVTSDLHLASDFKASAEEFRDAGSLGDLLAQTRYMDDQVAVHYSQRSFHAGMAGLGTGNMSWLHEAFINLLFDGGIPFKFISYEQVEKGELLKRRWPVLLMPHSISLSPQEVEAVKEYVGTGGVLWADIIPGTHNDFGQRIKEPLLKELFEGLKDVKLEDGTVIKTGSFGEGKVILADIGNYNYDRNVEQSMKAKTIMNKVADIASLKRVAKVEEANGKMANGVWKAGYLSGSQRYVIITKDWRQKDAATRKVKVRFPEKGYVYDMRTGIYLGEGDSVESKLPPVCGQAFAVLSYRLDEIETEMENEPKRGKDLILRIELDADGKIGYGDIHLLRVSVIGPNGKAIKSLKRKFLVRSVTGLLRLPLAYNDPEGTYTIRFHDQATGVKTQLTYKLSEKDGSKSGIFSGLF